MQLVKFEVDMNQLAKHRHWLLDGPNCAQSTIKCNDSIFSDCKRDPAAMSLEVECDILQCQ